MPKILPKVLSVDGRYVILNEKTQQKSKIEVREGRWRIPFLSWHPISSIVVPYTVLSFEADK